MTVHRLQMFYKTHISPENIKYAAIQQLNNARNLQFQISTAYTVALRTPKSTTSSNKSSYSKESCFTLALREISTN